MAKTKHEIPSLDEFLAGKTRRPATCRACSLPATLRQPIDAKIATGASVPHLAEWLELVGHTDMLGSLRYHKQAKHHEQR